MAFVEDLAAFFDVDDFASAATWFAGGVGGGVPVSGIFDAGHSGPGLGALSASDTEIVFRCAAADVEGVARGDTLKVGSVIYRIAEPRPDGTGVVVLVLKVI